MAAVALPPDGEISRGETEQFLLQAFRSFAEAADSLERSYGMLRSEVARPRGELEQSNAGLAKSLEQNRQMREHLDRILDGLPSGVLVAKADGAISLVNPEGRRLLGSSGLSSNRTAKDADDVASLSLSLVQGELRELLERAFRSGRAGAAPARRARRRTLAGGAARGGRGRRGLHLARRERRQAPGRGAGPAAPRAGAGGNVGDSGA